MLILRLLINRWCKRKVFVLQTCQIIYILWTHLFISMYFVRIFGMRFFRFWRVIEQDFCGEGPGTLSTSDCIFANAILNENISVQFLISALVRFFFPIISTWNCVKIFIQPAKEEGNPRAHDRKSKQKSLSQRARARAGALPSVLVKYKTEFSGVLFDDRILGTWDLRSRRAQFIREVSVARERKNLFELGDVRRDG